MSADTLARQFRRLPASPAGRHSGPTRLAPRTRTTLTQQQSIGLFLGVSSGREEPAGSRRKPRSRIMEEADTMRMRLGALLVALAGLCQAHNAMADHCGATQYSSCPQPCCEAQSSYPCQQGQCKTVYKQVYDNVLETRWHTCYKTVPETVMKNVTKTCYRDECKTVCKPVYTTQYRVEEKVCCKPVCKTCYREEICTVNKPCYETQFKECRYQICKKVPETCYKEVCVTVCKPVCEVHCHKACHQVTKQICEQHCREVCENVCRQVQEQHCREQKGQICKNICETVCKDVCCTQYQEDRKSTRLN